MRVSILLSGIAAMALTACATDDAPSGSEGGDTIVVTGAKSGSSRKPRPPRSEFAESTVTESFGDRGPTPSISPLPRDREPRDGPTPQSGTLTAGDYDDVLNPELYKKYVDRSLQGQLAGKDLPYVDAADRIEIRARDRLGKPIPRAQLTVRTSANDVMFPLVTGADGRAFVYPRFDDLEAGVSVSLMHNGERVDTAAITPTMLEEGGVIILDSAADARPVQKLDLVLTIDATGSMSDEMAYLQKELTAILDRVKQGASDLDIRAGLIAYRDQGDQYVVRSFPLTDDLAGFATFLNKQEAQGGGDFPEAMHEAMAAGLKFNWREDAAAINLLVADAPPHNDKIAETWRSALLARTRGIHIVPISGSGIDKSAEFLMRAMAQLTGGRYIFLTDDSGVGGKHKEAEVDCYVVTRLDGLVERVIESLVRGRRIEPSGDDVIRTVGAYRQGVCEVE